MTFRAFTRAETSLFTLRAMQTSANSYRALLRSQNRIELRRLCTIVSVASNDSPRRFSSTSLLNFRTASSDGRLPFELRGGLRPSPRTAGTA